jgi:hypothetical protein
MQNNPLYIRLKEISETGDYTVEQTEVLTSEQVKTLLGVQSVSDDFISNMKKLLISELEDARLQSKLEDLQGEQYMITNFPDAEYESGIVSDKPFIKIWPEGKA